jgi:uncharacterized protein YggT (Ycf19 family)
MGLTDLILNLAGLLLWFNGLSIRPDQSLDRPAAATLAGTLQRAAPRRPGRWPFVTALGALLLGRAFLYWHIGAAADWTPTLQLGVIAVSFPLSLRGDYFWYMLLYSLLSFGVVLGSFYLCLVLLSFLDGRASGSEPLLRLARAQLGVIARWPWPGRLLLPALGTAGLWLLLSPLLVWLGIVPRPVSWAHRLEQGALLGASVYLVWKYAIGALLALHLVNSYVYLGNHPLWTFVAVAAQGLLRPLRGLPLQVSKVDFAPLVMVAAVFLVAELSGRLLTQLYGRLPL